VLFNFIDIFLRPNPTDVLQVTGENNKISFLFSFLGFKLLFKLSKIFCDIDKLVDDSF
jgi:hypothetical protein